MVQFSGGHSRRPVCRNSRPAGATGRLVSTAARTWQQWLPALLLWLFASGLTPAPAVAQAPDSSASAATTVDESYRLNAGDEISVQVYGEAELSKQYAIGSNGMISFPFLGEVPVVGMTSREIGERLSDALRGTYLIDPKVTVAVMRYLPIYLNGQVKSPGALPYQPGLTVRKAISLAGGLTDRASSRRIFLIPAGENEGSKPRKVRMDHVIRPGDTITVEESFF